jgi:uncharacterized membrane protein
MGVLLFLHVLSVAVWVGGMFFAYMVLRLAAGETLQPPERLKLWSATLRRFFFWVWIAVALILISGIAMILRLGGFGAAAGYVHAMFALGIVMMLIFMHVFFAPYRRLTRHAGAGEWPAAGAALNQIRVMVGLNLAIGVVVIAIATLGRFGM